MFKNILILLILCLIFSCSTKSRGDEVLEMLEKTSKTSVNEGYIDGTDIEYYSNGKVKRETEMKGGHMNGMDFRYYENGVLAYEGFYKDGKLKGWEYYYHKNGKLYIKTDYLMSSNPEKFNQRFAYDSLGFAIDSLTDCFVITYLKDTITDSEPLIFDIELFTEWDNYFRIYYNLDSNFNTTTEYIPPFGKSKRMEYNFEGIKLAKGKNKLPIIVEHTNDIEKGKEIVSALRFYGYLEFYVK